MMFIRYKNTIKYVKVWASQTYQVFIANESVLNKSSKGAQILIKYPMSSLKTL